MGHRRLRTTATLTVLTLAPLLTAESCDRRTPAPRTTVVSPAATASLPAPPPSNRG